MYRTRLIIVLIFFVFRFTSSAQTQKIILNRQNIEGEWIYFNLNLDGISYKMYLSDVDGNHVFTEPNIDGFGIIEQETKKHDFFLQNKQTRIKTKSKIYSIRFIENLETVDIIIKKLKDKKLSYDVDLYDVFLPKINLLTIENSKEFSIDCVIENSKQRYVLLNYWSPFCGPCLKALSDFEELSNLSIELVNISEEDNNESTLGVLKNNRIIGTYCYPKKNDAAKLKPNGYPSYFLYDRKSGKLLKCSHNFTYILNYAYRKNIDN